MPAVSQGASAPCGLAKAAFGPAAARCSGPRAGDRSVRGRRLRALPWIGGRTGRLDGDGGPLRRDAVRHRKPGCPANPGSRREGAGRSSTPTFPARTASLPRVGEPADPGPRGFRKEAARRSHHRPRPAPARAAVRAREAAREGSFLETLKRREASFALPLVRTGSFRSPLAPRERPGDFRRGLPCWRMSGREAGETVRGLQAQPGGFRSPRGGR